MTARNLLRRHYDTYGGFFDIEFNNNKQKQQQKLRSANLMMMAEQPSIPRPHEQHDEEQQQQQEEEMNRRNTRGISKDSSWLQLSIGPSSSTSADPAGGGPSVELQLSRPWPSSSSFPIPSRSPAMMPSTSNLGYRPHHSSSNWGLMNVMPPPPPPMPQFYYNVQHQHRFPFAPPPATEMRVVAPPARRHQRTGLWFLLKAAENQVREPLLPQIPRSYIRIKDGRMTVRLLMKYLVNKLGLTDESEVEISCRGQRLHPFLTLQHVRDNIWCLHEAVTFLSDSPSIDHVMTLHYNRSS